MPKYLITANYSAEGMAGVRSGGAKSRVDAVSTMLERMGGSLDSFHFAFGDTDVFAIADVPDDEAAAAVAIAINSTGAVSTRTTKLLTIEQVDEALRRSVDYVPPGG
ncbi:MAG: GYD domain-containing protein [Sporichthyaceae bacterium]